MRKYYLIMIAMIACVMASCDSDDDSRIKVGTYVHISTLPPVDNEGNEESLFDEGTRSTNAASGANVQPGFEYGDSLGIFPDKGFQIPFELPIPAGTVQTAVDIFAEGWMTKDSVLYAVYFPFKRSAYLERWYNRIPWDYGKVQVQAANNDSKHLGRYWFLASDTVSADSGQFITTTTMMGAVLRVQAQVPTNEPYKKMVVVAANSNAFATHGYYDLFDTAYDKVLDASNNPRQHQPFHVQGTTDHISLLFTSCPALASGGKNYVIGWFVTPETLPGTQVTVYVWTATGVCYTGVATLSTALQSWRRNTVNKITVVCTTLTTTPTVNWNPWETSVMLSGVAI